MSFYYSRKFLLFPTVSRSKVKRQRTMFRETLVAILFSMAGFLPHVESQDSQRLQQDKPIPEFEILERMDRNGDRYLETAEIPGPARNFVDTLVTSSGAEKEVIGKNGRIDLNRLKSYKENNAELAPDKD